MKFWISSILILSAVTSFAADKYGTKVYYDFTESIQAVPADEFKFEGTLGEVIKKSNPDTDLTKVEKEVNKAIKANSEAHLSKGIFAITFVDDVIGTSKQQTHVKFARNDNFITVKEEYAPIQDPLAALHNSTPNFGLAFVIRNYSNGTISSTSGPFGDNKHDGRGTFIRNSKGYEFPDTLPHRAVAMMLDGNISTSVFPELKDKITKDTTLILGDNYYPGFKQILCFDKSGRLTQYTRSFKDLLRFQAKATYGTEKYPTKVRYENFNNSKVTSYCEFNFVKVNDLYNNLADLFVLAETGSTVFDERLDNGHDVNYTVGKDIKSTDELRVLDQKSIISVKDDSAIKTEAVKNSFKIGFLFLVLGIFGYFLGRKFIKPKQTS